MEQNQESSLFGLGIDATSKSHLSETGRWAKFLAIFGMIMCGLMVILGIFASVAISETMNREYGYRRGDTAGMGASMMIMYVLMAVIYFFPCLFTLRFANHMQSAIRSNDQAALNEAFKNLKITFRFVGILSIIVLAFLVLAIVLGGLTAIMSGF